MLRGVAFGFERDRANSMLLQTSFVKVLLHTFDVACYINAKIGNDCIHT